ncbi:MAG: hypothetical protein O3C10_10195 [Chloroflexi bacterium]|nr:hypothetical protein [Chloroflexota bacterium]
MAAPTSPSERVATQTPNASTTPTSDATPSPTSIPRTSAVTGTDRLYTSESVFDGLASEGVDPPDFVFVELGEHSNNLAARSFDDPDQWLASFAEWGREMGYVENYVSAFDEDTIQFAAEVYRDESGAEKSFDSQADDLKNRSNEYFKNIGLTVISSGEVEGGSVGEETFRYRARLADPDFGESGDLVIVMTRDANLIASVRWIAESNILVGETVGLAQGLLDAFGTALLVSSQPTPTAVPKATLTPTAVPTAGPTPSPIPTQVPIEIGNAQTEFVDYVDDQSNFSISFPVDWELADIDSEVRTYVAAILEEIGLPSQVPQVVFLANGWTEAEFTNLSIVVEVVPPSISSLSQYLDASVDGLLLANPNAEILETYTTPISGSPAGVIVLWQAGVDIDPELSDYTNRVFAAVFVNNGIGWAVLCSTTWFTLDFNDSQVGEICEEVVRSFDLSN